MALIECPECRNQISDKAVICPNCGYTLGNFIGGYEFRSQSELFGLPLVHIVLGYGIDPLTGRIRVAKGIIAVGNIAVGGIAVGGISFGALSLGGLSVGLISLGGVALGLLLALGGLAVGLVAIGGAAFGYYSFGGGAFGVHPFGGNQQDPNAIDFFRQYLGSWVENINQNSSAK